GSIASATASIAGIVKIADSLNSDATDTALTANQGKVLSGRTQPATTANVGIGRFATATEVANKANVMAAVTPKNIQDMFVGGFSENDSVTLPSRHILQWGVFTTINNQQATVPQYVNFPKSFAGKVFSVSLSVDALATTG